MRRRVALGALLVVIGLVAASCGSKQSSVLYDATATRDCLTSRPEYVPNASQPSTRSQMLVGHVFRVGRSKNQGGLFMPRGAASIVVVFAPAHTLRQDLVSVSFFPSEWSARQFHVALNVVLVKR